MQSEKDRLGGPQDIHAACARLFDGWCERRAVTPLRDFLRGWPLSSGLTDDWANLYEALRTVRANHFALLADEMTSVDSLIQTVSKIVYR